MLIFIAAKTRKIGEAAKLRSFDETAWWHDHSSRLLQFPEQISPLSPQLIDQLAPI